MIAKDLSVLTISINEVRDELAKCFTESLIEDEKTTYELIRDGRLAEFIPDLMTMSEESMCDKYLELKLGGKYFRDTKLDLVVVKRSNIMQIVAYRIMYG